MKCQMSCGREKTRVKWCKYVCDTCEPKPVFNFLVSDTINYKYYPKNGGNVSKARVEMMKSRYIVPDGNGEVAMKNDLGKRTDRKAYNY